MQPEAATDQKRILYTLQLRGAAPAYEEYRRELNEALEKADWMNPRDKNGPAYRVLARAARDKALPLAQWQKLHDEYYERTKR